ncbi:MAG: hypothetical protein AB7I25_00775 [Vicinamibacterales bacterium]
MLLTRRARCVASAVFGTLAVAGAARLAPSALSAQTSPVVLAVPGRVNVVPVMAGRGPFVAVTWAASAGTRTDAFVAVSRDGGRSFGAPVRANDISGTVRSATESGPRVALGPPAAGRTDPTIAVVWPGREPASTVRLTRSVDGGRTFAPSARLEGADAAGNRGWASVDVDAKGRTRVVWLDHRRLAAAATAAPAAASPGGGEHQHHGAARATGDAAATAASVARAQESGLYLWTGDRPAREVARGVCYCCRTAVASAADVLVAAWRHVYPGNLRDIALVRSVDAGASFGAVTRVSEDRWTIDGCPEDGPAVAVDGRGGVHVAWPTAVSAPADHKAVFYASSADGLTMQPRVLLSPRGRFVAHPAMALTGAGSPVVAWEGTGADRGIWITTRGANARFAPPVRASAAVDASYPSIVVSGQDVILAWREQEGAVSRIVVTRR